MVAPLIYDEDPHGVCVACEDRGGEDDLPILDKTCQERQFVWRIVVRRRCLQANDDVSVQEKIAAQDLTKGDLYFVWRARK